MAFDTDSGADYAAAVTRLLWPPPWTGPTVVNTRKACGPSTSDWYIFPSSHRPRILVPADLPAAATMLQRLGKGQARWSRLARRAAVRAVSTPGFRVVGWPRVRTACHEPGPADSIERYLSSSLGTPARVGILLGTRRANQKPVLQVFGADGAVIGYAKIGHNALTAPLVRAEAAALQFLGDHQPETFRVPRLIHQGQWRSLEVLVMSALPGTAASAVPEEQRIAAMAELAHIAGPARHRLADSTYWKLLQERAEEIAEVSLRSGLLAGLTEVAARWGHAEVDFGSWHGDWGEWNMAVSAGTLQLWDWERFDREVPVGFDLLHHQVQRLRPGQQHAEDRTLHFPQEASDSLVRFGVSTGAAAPTVATYLLEVGVRYASAIEYAETAALRRRVRWTLEQVQRVLQAAPAAPNRMGGYRHESA